MTKKNARSFPYWETEIETLPVPDLRRLQAQRLEATLARVRRVPFYRDRLPLAPKNALDALSELPFTTKDDLRALYPYGLLAVPREDCIRIHASSGTTGRATAVLHTRHDIATWSKSVARCLVGVGVGKTDVFQNMAGYGLFTGGLGFHYGAELVGALTVPAGAGNSRRQIQLMRDFGTTAVHLMPSYAIRLGEVFAEMGLDPKRDTKLAVFFLGAEPHSEETRRRIEDFYGVDAYDSYGLSEMNGPGVSFECPMKDGLHIWEDNFIVELIDPHGDKPVAEGERGELVYTTLAREAMPLLRYRSRDLAYAIPEPCACGRTHRRISRIQGRIDDMFTFKGVTIFPVQVESVLMDIPEVDGNFEILLQNEEGVDILTIDIEVTRALVDHGASERLRQRIRDLLHSDLQVRPQVRLLPQGSLPAADGNKKSRVRDTRVP